MKMRRQRPRLAAAGIALIDCLIYIAVVTVILGMAFGLFSRFWRQSVLLQRDSSMLVRALQAGERWRADVRSATGQPMLDPLGDEFVFRIPRGEGEIQYSFSEASWSRRETLPGNETWVVVLPKLKHCVVAVDARSFVEGWRLEFELAATGNHRNTKPVFTFLAVACPPHKP